MQILLCTDGSTHGQEALRFGSLLARRSSQPATLLGVVEPGTEQAGIEAALEEGKSWLAGAPAPRVRVRTGHAAEEILAEASREDYDLVVVGARGKRGITRFLMGSTSERIARQAAIPVLIVRGHHPQAGPVLACTGGRAPGLAAVRAAAQVAHLLGTEVTVLHVMSQLAATPMSPKAGMLKVMPQTPAPPATSAYQLGDLKASAEDLIAHGSPEGKHLEQALGILSELGVPARALVRHGLVVDEISAEACGGDYGLVVVGASAAEGWMRLFLQNVGHQILDCCPELPILVAKT